MRVSQAQPRVVKYGSSLIVESPPTSPTFIALNFLPIISISLHHTRPTSWTENTITPPNHPEKPRASIPTRNKIKKIHKSTMKTQPQKSYLRATTI